MTPRGMSLRRKIAWTVTLLMVILLLATLIVMRHAFDESLARNLDRRMTTIGSTVGLVILPALVVSGGQIDERIAEVEGVLRRTVSLQKDIAEITVLDEEREILLRYPRTRPDLPPDRQQSLNVPLRLTAQGKIYGYVGVVFDLEEHRAARHAVMMRFVVVGLVVSLAGMAAAFLLAGNITRPIERLRDGAIAFGRRQYGTRVAVERDDEIGVLASTFNEMAESIDNQIRRIIQLQEWGRVVSANLERSLVIEKVVEAFAELGGVSKMSLMILNEQTGLLEIVGGIGLRPDAMAFMKLKPGEGIAGKVMSECKKRRVDRIADDDEYKSFSGKSSGGQMLALPLMAKRTCFGVVNLHEKHSGKAFDDSDETILETLAEIAAVALENARLYDLAITDGLTRLFIGRYFHQRLEEEIVRTRRTALPLALLMCDIDHFKRVNDTYGHQTGDAVLIALARIAKQVFREVDIPCRYGGEEFAIILPNTDKPGSSVVAERFRSAVEKHVFITPTGEHRITISIGAASYIVGRTKDELIGEADKALYAAKEAGRNRVVQAKQGA